MILYHGLTAAQSESLVSKIVEKNVQLLMNEFSLDLESAFAFIYKTKVFDALITFTNLCAKSFWLNASFLYFGYGNFPSRFVRRI